VKLSELQKILGLFRGDYVPTPGEERQRGYEDAYYSRGEHPPMGEATRSLDARRDAYADGYEMGERARKADRG